MRFPQSLSLKTILVILFGGITLLSALPTYWYINHIHTQRLVADRGDGLRDLAKASASVLAANLRERRREAELLAQSSLFRDGALDSVELSAVLNRTQKSFPHYSWIGLADPDGTVQSSTGNLLVGQSVKARPWFFNAFKDSYSGDLHDALLLSKLLQAITGSGPLRLIDFSEPVRDSTGRLRGVLGMHVNWDWASDVLKDMQPANAVQSKVEIMIVNQDGKVIHPRAMTDSVALPEALTVREPFLIGRWSDGVDYVSSMVPVNDGAPPRSMQWRIVTRQPVTDAFRELTMIQQGLLAAVLASAALLIATVWWGAGLVTRPLRALAEQARAVEAGHEQTQWSTSPVSREMHHLVAALRGMANTLLQRKQALADSNAVLEEAVQQRTAELVRTNEELHRLSRRDPLTGLFNRLAADENLRSQFVRMKRMQHRYAVMMVDIDFFKRVNDTYGHEIGDQVLQGVAQVLQARLRETDFLARFGGEEFLIILPEIDLAAALDLAEKLRAAVESADNATGQAITLSVGLAMADSGDAHEDDAVRSADQCLYQAKHTGRNRVVART